MKVLIKESIDKKIRTIIDIPNSELLEKLNYDNGFHEVICCRNPDSKIRLFFDYDCNKDFLEDFMKVICEKYHCEKSDWAISCGTREGKVSYHILSKKFCITIRSLIKTLKQMKKQHPYIDDTVLNIDMFDDTECAFLRFPNQSKDGVNKPAPPMKILQGELSDFLITDIHGLTMTE
jgi:hypothetical protein